MAASAARGTGFVCHRLKPVANRNCRCQSQSRVAVRHTAAAGVAARSSPENGEEPFFWGAVDDRLGQLRQVLLRFTRRKVNWVLDVDIRGFFDTLDHGWLMKLLEVRISDRRVLRLIAKWLRAGVSEDRRLGPHASAEYLAQAGRASGSGPWWGRELLPPAVAGG